MSRFSRPLPEKVSVSSFALAQIVNALNDSISAVRSLLVTRDDSITNPIDIIERELMEAQAAPSTVASEEPFIDGELHNHKRQGGPGFDAVLRLADYYLATNDRALTQFKSELKRLYGEQA